MTDVNVLPATAFEAIAEAQGTYGVPDRLIALIAQCSMTQIFRNRKRVGWTIRKVPLAYLRGQMPGAGLPKLMEASDSVSAENEGCVQESAVAVRGAVNVPALRDRIEQLLWRLTDMLTTEEGDALDPLLPKQVDAVGVVLKYLERLEVMRNAIVALASSSHVGAQSDPEETARVLRKIEKRVEDLADRKARDIIGAVDGSGSDGSRAGVDDQRTDQSDTAIQT